MLLQSSRSIYFIHTSTHIFWFQQIIVEEQPALEEHPPTTPPPTHTDSRDMDSPIQIQTTKTDDRQVSIFAQPSILAGWFHLVSLPPFFFLMASLCDVLLSPPFFFSTSNM